MRSRAADIAGTPGGKRQGEAVIGKTGRVTGKVGPGLVGEVMLAVRGGVEAFYAYPVDGEVIEVGTRVVVVDFEEPRNAYVAALG
jgi:hypothetical protein